MYEVYAKQAIEWWKAQIGKKCGKTNEYSAYMDGYKFYNYPKNGISDSCAIFYDTAIMKTMSPEANANAARAILCEPNVDNCGAGCVFKVDYYKKAGRWIPGTNPSAAQSGDEIFFYKDSYKKKENPYGVYHTGTIVNWDNKGFYVVEGNTNGGMVAQKFYAYNNPLILGFGRPKWTGWLPDPEPTPEPTPTPTPEPVPEDNKYKVVNIKTFLAIRSTPEAKKDDSNKIGELYNGAIVTVLEQSNGWARISGEAWVSMSYLSKI